MRVCVWEGYNMKVKNLESTCGCFEKIYFIFVKNISVLVKYLKCTRTYDMHKIIRLKDVI